MGHLRNFIRKFKKNPLEKVLKHLPCNAKIVFFWNRGLGDIPLELFSFCQKIRSICPNATLCVITREDLKEGFMLLDGLTIYTSPLLKRKQEEPYDAIFEELNLNKASFDHIFYKPDPAYWVFQEKKQQQPSLSWKPCFETHFQLANDKKYAFLHLHSETIYGFEKNLSKEKWEILLADLKNKGYTTIALGASQEHLDVTCDIDLRGKTSLFDIITGLIYSHSIFIGPDSGLLNILYFLNIRVPLYLLSFWANTKVGILQNKHPSPNPLLIFETLIAPDGLLSKLDLKAILDKIPIHPKHPHVFGLAKSIQNIMNFEQSLEKATQELLGVKELYRFNVPDIQNPNVSHLDNLEEQDDRIIPIILAGGQGTRLQTPLPKAVFEINGLSLIGHFCKKIQKASLKFQKPLKSFLMVSEEGYLPILNHLQEQNFFGLQKDQLILVKQKSLPFLNFQNQFVLNEDQTIQSGPSGNGEVFHLLKEQGLLKNLDPATCFEIIPIDNPLAPLFLKAHKQTIDLGFDVSILAIEDQSPNLGKIGQTPTGIQIIEYSEKQIDTLRFANTGLLCFSLAFVKNIVKEPISTYHIAKKKYPCLVKDTMEYLDVQKFESFIFDHLNKASCHILIADQKKIFQPLKTIEGRYGIEALKNALIGIT